MRTREFILLVYLTDLILLNLAIYRINYLLEPTSGSGWFGSTVFWVFNIAWFIIYLFFIDDSKPYKKCTWDMLRNMVARLVSFFALMSLAIFILEIQGYIYAKDLILLVSFSFAVLKIIKSIFIYHLFSWYWNTGKSPILLVGNYKEQSPVLSYIESKGYLGLSPLGILTDDPNDVGKEGVLGTFEDFQTIYDKTPFNDVIISVPLYERNKINHLMDLSEKNGVRPRLIPNWGKVQKRKFISQSIGGDIPLLDVRRVPLYDYPNRFWKRAFDIVFSFTALLALLPVFLLIAILIKLDSKGPIFYKPTRLGVNNRPFVVYKFRSMRQSDEANTGTKSTVENDERITKLGKFLRKANLDELPQLINVLKNEMSIVGPRPHRVYLNQKLKEKMGSYMVRHFVKPGITGWAQVNGWRGPTETKLQYQGRTLHDLWYVENWSFLLDIYIVFLTVFGTKVKKNAY